VETARTRRGLVGLSDPEVFTMGVEVILDAAEAAANRRA